MRFSTKQAAPPWGLERTVVSHRPAARGTGSVRPVGKWWRSTMALSRPTFDETRCSSSPNHAGAPTNAASSGWGRTRRTSPVSTSTNRRSTSKGRGPGRSTETQRPSGEKPEPGWHHPPSTYTRCSVPVRSSTAHRSKSTPLARSDRYAKRLPSGETPASRCTCSGSLVNAVRSPTRATGPCLVASGLKR